MGRCRKVRCIETGEVFNSIREAQEYYKCYNIPKVLSGEYKKDGGYHWEYADNSDLDNEIWKGVIVTTNSITYDYSDLYECSNMGRIRNINNKKIMNGGKNNRGYRSVSLTRDKVSTKHLIHRIIATTWIPNPENKPTVDHINTNRCDNRVENLRWATMDEQMNNNEKTIENISKRKKRCMCLNTGEIFDSVRDAADKYNLREDSISRCCRGERKNYKGKKWKYIEED